MKLLKRTVAFLMAAALLFALAGCGTKQGTDGGANTSESDEREFKTKVASITGAPGLSLLKVKTDRDYAYDVEFYSTADEIVNLIKNNEVDIAVIPVSNAASLYRETVGGIMAIAVNSLGSLQLITSDESVKDFDSLKGKTIHLSGKGTLNEYIVRFLLSQKDIDPDNDVTFVFEESHKAIQEFAEKSESDVCILPEPYASNAIIINEKLARVFDMTKLWNNVTGKALAQTVVVARTEFINDHTDLVKEFLGFDQVSVNFVGQNQFAPQEIVDAGFITNIQSAVKCITGSNFHYLENEEMKDAVSSTLTIMNEYVPDFISEVPDNGFYYNTEKKVDL